MAQSIGSLVAELSANTASFQKDMGKAAAILNSHAAQMNRTVAGVERNISGIGKAFTAALSVGSVVNFIKSQADLGQQLANTAETLGFSVEKWSAYQYAARITRVDNDALTGSVAKLGKSLNDAVADPAGKAAKAFKGLGVETKDANGQMRSLESIFEDVAARLAQVSNEDPARLAYEMTLFGESGHKLAPLINRLSELTDEAQRTGNVIGKDFTESAKRFNAETARMTHSLGTFLARADSGPNFFDGLVNSLKGIQFFALGVAQGFEEAGTAIGAYAATADRVAHLDFKGASEILKMLDQDLAAIQQKGEKARAILFELPGAATSSTNGPSPGPLSPPPLGTLPPLGSSIDADIEKLKARALAIQAQLNPMDELAQKLTELEKLRPFLSWDALSDIEAQYWKESTAAADKSNDELERQRRTLLASIGDVQTLQEEMERITALFTDPTTGNIMAQYLSQYYDIINKVQDDWHNKTKTANSDLVTDTNNAVDQLRTAIKGWGDSFTDQLADMVMAGKFNFKSLADSIIRDLLRIAIQKSITNNIISSTGGAGPWLQGIGSWLGFAEGGNPPIGRASLVGENGPELIVPRSATTVIPNGAMGGSVFNIDARGADSAGLARLEGMIRQLDGSIENRSVSAWVRDRSRGGVTASFA